MFRAKHAVHRNRGGSWRDRWMGWASCRTAEGVFDLVTTRRTFFKATAMRDAHKQKMKLVELYYPLQGT